MGLCGDGPDVPDPAEAAVQNVYTQLELLPFIRQIEAAAALGKPVTIDGKLYDFGGLGDAEYNRQYSDRMAQAMLNLQREYGDDYIRQRLSEMDLAQPGWMDMRQRLFNQIQGDVHGDDPNRQTAEDLQASILAELEKGGELDPIIAKNFQQGVRGQQVARGNVYGNAAIAQEARVMAGASEEQRRARQAQALNFLVSGATPEDVTYRRTQQNLQNLGSFIGGPTPQALFGQLAGAQQGAAPFVGGNQLSGVNQGGAQNALGYYNQIYAGDYITANNTINPWIAGLGFGVQGAGLGAQLGKK